jgi:hypothetical protein
VSKRKSESEAQYPERRFEGAIENLLRVLCVDFGFCGDSHHAPFDLSRTSWTADDFAVEVLRAEGMNPLHIEGIGPSQSDYFKLIRDQFVARFGASISVEDFTEEGAARRLALLGGSDPSALAPPRRRR